MEAVKMATSTINIMAVGAIIIVLEVLDKLKR
jgi:hypothetical protein